MKTRSAPTSSRSSPTAPATRAAVKLTRPARSAASQPEQRGPANREAQLPHERDQHPDSQAGPEAPNQEVGEQAFLDVSHGLVDTDENLRATSVARGQASHAEPAAPVTKPRRAVPRDTGNGEP